MSASANYPPPEAIARFLAPTTRHTRRIELYEQDAVTRWSRDTTLRLKSGGVTIDGDRDERRTLDIVLDNSDNTLQNAPGELWYDKVVKVFRGVHLNKATRVPRILVLADKTGQEETSESFRQAAVSSGFGNVQVNTLVSTWDVVSQYDIIVGLANATSTQVDLLTQAYRSGKSVFVMDSVAVAWIPKTFTNYISFVNSFTPNIAPSVNQPNQVAQGWEQFSMTSEATTTVYNVTQDNWTAVGTTSGSNFTRIGTAEDAARGGKAVAIFPVIDYQQYDEPEFVAFIASALMWLNPLVEVEYWETQVGEFMIDRITEPHFPHEVRITGRDYAKKCKASKFTQATQFDPGYNLESLISQLASNAGIQKRQLPATDVVVGRTFYFDRGVSRWDAMKEIATAYNYDLFFNAQGYLVLKKFSDPSTDAPVFYIQTGKDGQIASYEKSTSDARLYNHVLVTGESSDSDVLPVWATAVNDDPRSPSRRSEIGDRLYEYTSSFITTTAQAQSVADSFLAVHSLEEFELNFETLMLPWMEAGELIGFIDPRPAKGDPTVFLLTNLTIPLALGPMGGTARRVTNTG